MIKKVSFSLKFGGGGGGEEFKRNCFPTFQYSNLSGEMQICPVNSSFIDYARHIECFDMSVQGACVIQLIRVETRL